MELASRNASGEELVQLVDVPVSRLRHEKVRPDSANNSYTEEDPAHFTLQIRLVGIDEVGKDDLGRTCSKSTSGN